MIDFFDVIKRKHIDKKFTNNCFFYNRIAIEKYKPKILICGELSEELVTGSGVSQTLLVHYY